MLLGCVRSYLKSVLRYKFLISATYHSAIIHLREQGCKDLWAHFEAKRNTRANKLGETLVKSNGRMLISRGKRKELVKSAIIFYLLRNGIRIIPC